VPSIRGIPSTSGGYRDVVTPPTYDRSPAIDTAVLDVDGTLVDSVYAHVWAWREAFRLVGVDVPTWRIHRAIGMGGDRLVEAVANATVEHHVGDDLRSLQSGLYGDLSAQLRPTPGATDLLETLKKNGLLVVLASSGSREDTDSSVSLLEAVDLIDGSISGDDTDATKPDTEPVQRAVDSVHGRHALVIGDSVWDMTSARRAGHEPVGLLTGGVAACELLEGGAEHVYDDPAQLAGALDDLLASHR
jgi:HAD superfamily hydrolase (TIGR01549 family)